MSLVKVSGNASGTGTLTIAAPNTNSDFTLTLPQNTGTLLSTASTGQVIPKAALPTGSVLQVVQGVTTTSTLISAGPTDTTLTATITPTSATSTILIVVNQFVYLTGGGGDSGFQLFILKNGSVVYNNISNSLYIASTSGSPEMTTNYPITYLDSPATTSALTYKTQATATAGGTPTFQQGSNQSTITLMEISA
jgi:hypothetical protein